ncbi:MAG: hypothetical protein ACE5ID_08630 [Acidobacteriota bacterium]
MAETASSSSHRLRRTGAAFCLAGLGLAAFMAGGSPRAGENTDAPAVETVKAGEAGGFTLPEKIDAVLEDPAFAVSQGGEPLAFLRLRKEWTLQKEAVAGLGVSFAAIPLSSLVGAIHLKAPWTDYRGVAVPAGTYTLRYGIQPADGNHMGVSVYRDFLILLKPDDDPGPSADLDLRRLVDLGKKSSGAAHPWVLGLYPVEDGVEPPCMARNEMDHWMLVRRANGLTLGLVILGQETVEGN